MANIDARLNQSRTNHIAQLRRAASEHTVNAEAFATVAKAVEALSDVTIEVVDVMVAYARLHEETERNAADADARRAEHLQRYS